LAEITGRAAGKAQRTTTIVEGLAAKSQSIEEARGESQSIGEVVAALGIAELRLRAGAGGSPSESPPISAVTRLPLSEITL
jgi:hypothetical protein